MMQRIIEALATHGAMNRYELECCLEADKVQVIHPLRRLVQAGIVEKRTPVWRKYETINYPRPVYALRGEE